MRKLIWFTHTNIDTRKVINNSTLSLSSTDSPNVSFDLTEFLLIFKQNKIWERKKYRTEYIHDYNSADFEKIHSIKINLHSKHSPFSNCHDYENVLEEYIDRRKLSQYKIASSGISEANQIAVIIIEFKSENKIIDDLTYEEEKDIEIVIDKLLTQENYSSWDELNKIKSIACEFIQFFNFNLHLNFLSKDYEFSFTEKPNLTGFITVVEKDMVFYQTDKIDFLANYIFFDENKASILETMRKTSVFWHKQIPTIHFFLDALKGII